MKNKIGCCPKVQKNIMNYIICYLQCYGAIKNYCDRCKKQSCELCLLFGLNNSSKKLLAKRPASLSFSVSVCR